LKILSFIIAPDNSAIAAGTPVKKTSDAPPASLLVLLLLILFTFTHQHAQAGFSPLVVSLDSITQNDTLPYPDELPPADNLVFKEANDTIVANDTISKAAKAVGIENKVIYNSFEKIQFDVVNRKVYLFENADITYGNIRLKADYVEIDFDKNEVYARGVPDSLGVMRGTPVFTEGNQEFESHEMTYNFDTRKGIIRSVITQDGEGYIHGERIKKMEDDRINVLRGSYTTCDLPHPHYEFRYTRAQVIPDRKIVSGPAYMVIEGVPIPLALPFGLFPNKSGQRSGILIPRYGEAANRGFYFERLGYYWGINDYMDFTITGDIFTSGSWAIRPTMRYRNRYKYSGNFDFNYAKNFLGDRDSPDRDVRTDFSVRWTHSQDPRARPNSRFSANVNIVSSSFNQFNLTGADAYLSNTFQSSIAYQTNFNNDVFITLNGSHQQNTINRTVNITLPSLSVNTRQIYPFRRQQQTGGPRWYENITTKYSMTAENRIQTLDTLLFKPGWENDIRSGVRHNIPVSSSITVLNYFTLTNSANYTERWYPYSIRRTWNGDTIINQNDTIFGRVEVDTVRAVRAARDFSFSSSLSTRLYGMFQINKGPLAAVRHVLTPSLSFTYRPDFGSDFWGYWDEVQINQQGDTRRFSQFEGLLYGAPPDGRSGNISFQLTNNLEAKVRSKRAESPDGLQKVVLIENFTVSGGYDIARDSLNWSPVTVSGRTTLFKRLNITYSSSWDPYAVDSLGNTINQFEWDVNNKLFRMRNTTWNFGINYRISSADFKRGSGAQTTGQANEIPDDPDFLDQYTQEEISDVFDNPDMYINWDNPWSLSINYNLRFQNNPRYRFFEREDVRTRVNTVGISGDISITPKWKVAFRTGYDFESKQLAFTMIDFYRDLHCWEMRFNWTPIGFRKSWSFGINVKASILKDLKYDRRKDFRDAF
jgi:lipopolysaccharide assembly outer membrane protein LptD (OstA)